MSTHHSPAYGIRAHEFANSNSGPRCIVRNYGQVLFLLVYKLIDDKLRAADAHKSADIKKHSSGIISTAWSALWCASLSAVASCYCAIHPPSKGSATPRISPRMLNKKDGQGAQLSTVANSCEGCFSESNRPGPVDRQYFRAWAPIVELLLHKRRQNPAWANGIARDARSSLSRARRPWSSRPFHARRRRKPTFGSIPPGRAVDAILMMRPQLRSSICGNTALVA